MLDRRLRLRVYRNGNIVAHVDVPFIDKTISTAVFHSWLPVLGLIERCEREWLGLDWKLIIKHQGL